MDNLVFSWKDKWSNQAFEEQFPQAHSFAKNKAISVRKASDENIFTNLFSLPLSQVAFEQAMDIQQILENNPLDDLSNDVWTYSGGSAKFKSTVAYKHLLGHNEIDPAFR